MGSSAPKAAKPSALEQELERENITLLREQRASIAEQTRIQNLLAPILYKTAGIKPIYGAGKEATKVFSPEKYRQANRVDRPELMDMSEEEVAQEWLRAGSPGGEEFFVDVPGEPGQLTGFEEIPTEETIESVDPEAAEIEQRLQERTLAALKGELPIDPALMTELQRQEQILRQGLEKQLGPGWETSTPGMEALAEFNERKAALVSQASRGDITLGEQLGIARESANSGRMSDILNRSSTVLSNIAGVSGLQGSTIGDMFGVSQGYGNILNNMRQNRIVNLNAPQNPNVGASVGSGALSGAMAGSAAGPWGALIGGVAGAAMGGLSASSQRRG